MWSDPWLEWDNLTVRTVRTGPAGELPATYSMALMRKPYRMCGKRSMPPEWLDPLPHTHVALDDAVEQGRLFCNMMKANGAAGIESE